MVYCSRKNGLGQLHIAKSFKNSCGLSEKFIKLVGFHKRPHLSLYHGNLVLSSGFFWLTGATVYGTIGVSGKQSRLDATASWSIFDQPPIRGLEISIFQCIISNRKSNEIPKKETWPSRESKVGASRCGVEAYYSLRSLQVERKEHCKKCSGDVSYSLKRVETL